MNVSHSDIGLLVLLYDVKGFSKKEVKRFCFGYDGGAAERKIQEFVELGILKSRKGLLESNKNEIIRILQVSGKLSVMERIVDDSEPTVEEKLVRLVK